MMLTQKDSSIVGFSKLASILSPCCWEHFRMRSSVPSTVSTMAVPPCGIDACVSAYNRHGLFSLLGGDGQDNVKNQRRQHGAVPSLRSEFVTFLNVLANRN
jgi:hypothetical protein